MIGILILGLSTILAGALPWWPYSATGRLRHQKPWDWLMDQNRLTGGGLLLITASRTHGDTGGGGRTVPSP